MNVLNKKIVLSGSLSNTMVFAKVNLRGTGLMRTSLSTRVNGVTEYKCERVMDECKSGGILV
jgi:hypothetical protein